MPSTCQSEGNNIPQINGVLTDSNIKKLKDSTLIEGKEYSCQNCGKIFKAPFVSRCICGLRICENCYPEHEAGG